MNLSMLSIPVRKTLQTLKVEKYTPSDLVNIPLATPNVIASILREEDDDYTDKPTRTPKGFNLIGINQDDIRHGGFLGVEFETRFEPTGQELRAMRDFILKHKLMPIVTGQYDVLRCLRDDVLNNLSEIIIDGPPINDGGGLEFRFHPITLKAHHVLREEYIRIIGIVKSFGFIDGFGNDGIHINIDNNLLGSNAAERRFTFANFIWFLFKNGDFMNEFCGRTKVDDGLADILSLLGNRMGDMSPESLSAEFLSEKNELLDAIENDLDHRGLNIHVNKDGRPCVEFRWFGSTHSINKFMSFIEFCHAIITYCKIPKSPKLLTLQKFCIFVRQNKQNYADLQVRLESLETTKVLINSLNYVPESYNYMYILEEDDF